jgi:pSer/pThr/pTyr-binding forkhead associated (FHA) protein
MIPEIIQGTFFWYWANSWAALHGLALAMTAAILAIFTTTWTPTQIFMKIVITTCVVLAMPLGVVKMGLDIPMANSDLSTYLNFTGTVMAVVVSALYLFRETLKPFSNPIQPTTSETAGFGLASSSNTQVPQYTQSTPSGIGDSTTWQNTLNIKNGPGFGNTMTMGKNTFTVGRSVDNDLVIDDPSVSRNHARITSDGKDYYIEDLNSTSGTHLDGLKISKSQIASGATIRLGNSEIEFNQRQMDLENDGVQRGADLSATRIINSPDGIKPLLIGTSGSATGQTFDLVIGDNIVGRDSTCNVMLSDSYISRQHAMIKLDQGITTIFDLGSTGGTKVNGKEISGGNLEVNSSFRVGQTEITLVQVDNPRQFAESTLSNKTMVDHRGNQCGALIIKSGVDAGKSFLLSEGDNIVGRGNTTGVSLSDDSVSRKHAVIRCTAGKAMIFDVGSKSGTILNGCKLGGTRINSGDTITFGRTQLTMM